MKPFCKRFYRGFVNPNHNPTYPNLVYWNMIDNFSDNQISQSTIERCDPIPAAPEVFGLFCVASAAHSV